MQFERKLLMIQTQKNKKILEKLILGFGPDLGPLDPNSVHHLFFFFCFFSKNLASSVISYHHQLSSCTISEKTNDPILRKFSDGKMDRWTDRQRYKGDFIGCCLILSAKKSQPELGHVLSNPFPLPLLFLMHWFFGWMCHHTTSNVLFCLMIVWT